MFAKINGTIEVNRGRRAAETIVWQGEDCQCRSKVAIFTSKKVLTVGDVEVKDTVLDHGAGIGVVNLVLVGDVALLLLALELAYYNLATDVSKDLAGLHGRDNALGDARVGATDPEQGRSLRLGELGEEVGVNGRDALGPRSVRVEEDGGVEGHAGWSRRLGDGEG